MANVIALINAARRGDTDEVRRLVEIAKVDPNEKCEYRSPLMVACPNKRTEVVRYLVEEAQVRVDGGSIIGAACARESAIIESSIEVGLANVSKSRINRALTKALRTASLLGGLDVIRYLVERGKASDVNWVDRVGWTPVQIALERRDNQRKAIVAYLLPRVGPANKRVLVQVWRLCSDWDIREIVLEKLAVERHGSDYTFKTNPIHSLLQFPLSLTSAKDCLEHYPPSTLSILDSNGRLPIHAVLTSVNGVVRRASIVLLVAKREPRSVCSRDPITGLFPYETAAAIVGKQRHRRRQGRCQRVA